MVERPNDAVDPYRIQVDEGGTLYAPLDHDCCIRASETKSPACWICFDDEMSSTNPIVRECACRGIDNGFVHVGCLVRLAKTKAEVSNRQEPNETHTFAWTRCITCKREFERGKLCSRALTKACREEYRDEEVGSVFYELSNRMLTEQCIHDKDYPRAKIILNVQIAQVKKKVNEGGHDFETLMEQIVDRLLQLSYVLSYLDDDDGVESTLIEGLQLLPELEESASVSKEIMLMSALSKHREHMGKIESAFACMYDAYHSMLGNLTEEYLRVSAPESLAQMKIEMGRLYIICNALDEGKELVDEAIDIMNSVFGEDHPSSLMMQITKRHLTETYDGTNGSGNVDNALKLAIFGNYDEEFANEYLKTCMTEKMMERLKANKGE